MASLEIKPAPRQRLRVFSLLFFATALALLLAYLLVGGGGNLVARRSHLVTYMSDAGGITTESEVRLSGIRVGTVEHIELSGSLDPEHAVRIDMQVLSRFLRSIPEDSQTDISADTLIGVQFIDIAEGKSAMPIREDAVLPSEPIRQAQDRADLMKRIQNELAQVDQILVNISSPNSDLGAFILGSKEYDQVLDRIVGFDDSLHSFLNPQSDLGKAFYTDQVYNQVRRKISAVDNQLASLESGSGAMGHMLASDEQYETLLRALRSLRSTLADVNAGKGRFAPMLQDDAAWQKTRRTLADLDRTLAEFNAGNGTAAHLFANSQVYDSLNGSLRTLEQLLRDIREHPGNHLRVKP